MARDANLQVAIRQDVKQRFKEIADAYGVTMSALASLIIGQWVYSQEKVIGPMLEAMRDAGVHVVKTEFGKDVSQK